MFHVACKMYTTTELKNILEPENIICNKCEIEVKYFDPSSTSGLETNIRNKCYRVSILAHECIRSKVLCSRSRAILHSVIAYVNIALYQLRSGINYEGRLSNAVNNCDTSQYYAKECSGFDPMRLSISKQLAMLAYEFEKDATKAIYIMQKAITDAEKDMQEASTSGLELTNIELFKTIHLLHSMKKSLQVWMSG